MADVECARIAPLLLTAKRDMALSLQETSNAE